MGISIKKISISPGFLLLISALCIFTSGEFLAAAALAIVIHEMGHFAAIKLCGGKIKKIYMQTAGFAIEYGGILSYRKEAIAAVSGPIASAALAVSMSYLAKSAQSEFLYLLSGISFSFAVFNILPVLPLDGGRAAFAVIAGKFDIFTAERILCILSCAVAFVLLVCGTYLLFYTGNNPTLLIVAAWMLISYCKRSGNVIKLRQ